MGAPEDVGKGKPILETGDRAFTMGGMGSARLERDPGGLRSNALLKAGPAEELKSLSLI